MAFSTRSSLLIFFTTLVLLSTQTHARDSYFFGKFHRESPKDQNPLEASEKTTVEEESIPNKKDQEQDPTFLPESENGYGLYGHETSYNNQKDEFNNQKEEFNNNNNNNNNNNKYDGKVNGETFSTPSLSETKESFENYDENYPKKTESYYNNEEFNNNNNNKYDGKVNEETFSTPSLSETEESFENYDEKYPKKTESYYNNEEFNNKYDENVKEEGFSENNEDNKRSFYNSNAYGTELERETPYKGYNHNLERQGMSDTRFMSKGNYYYDLYNDKNHGHFYRKPQRKTPSGYYTSPETESNYEQSSYSSGNNNNNNNEENSFKDPYNSKWEKNVMNEQPQEFAEEQVEPFKP